MLVLFLVGEDTTDEELSYMAGSRPYEVKDAPPCYEAPYKLFRGGVGSQQLAAVATVVMVVVSEPRGGEREGRGCNESRGRRRKGVVRGPKGGRCGGLRW